LKAPASARKAKQLSSLGTLENNPQPDAAGSAPHDSTHEGDSHEHHEHESHEHEAHAHEGHEHEGHEGHQHGPVLNPECTRELVIDVPAEDVSKAYRRVAANYRKYAKFPGFRPGKAPESVVRRRFAGEIRKEVIDSLLPERFNQAVNELGVRPVGQPQVTELTVEEGAPLHVKAAFEYLPDFSIEGYESVAVPKPAVDVTEEEFQQEIDRMRDSRATIEPVEEDRALVDGDWAQISYKGQVEGEDTPPIEGEDSLVEIGGKETVQAFSDALRGAKPGQELKAEVVYPADYDPKLAGKTVSYEVTVKAIKKRTVPELNDEFAKEIGEYENYAELETSVRDHLQNRKRRGVENETKERLFGALAERFQFPVPESLVQDQIDARLERGLRALAAQGMNPEQMRKMDFGRLRGAQRESALGEVKASILLDRIAQAENITVSDEEMDHELQMAALQSREPLDTLKVRLTQDGGLARIREQLRREKTANLLYERLPA
jgi:trigger factor